MAVFAKEEEEAREIRRLISDVKSPEWQRFVQVMLVAGLVN